jgi:hypothetical protein
MKKSDLMSKKLIDSTNSTHSNRLDLNIEEKKRIESFDRLINMDLHRSVIKKSIMTLPYNTTRHQGIKYLKDSFKYEEIDIDSIIDNVESNFDKYSLDSDSGTGVYDPADGAGSGDTDTAVDKLNTINESVNTLEINKTRWYRHSTNSNIILTQMDFQILYDTLKEVIYIKAPSLTRISDYLKTLAEICSKADSVIPWTLPTGLMIYQSYNVMKELRISPFNYSKYTYSIKKKAKKMDTKKNIRALMPNLIHSLDAASLSLLIHSYFNNYNNKIKNIFGIHDCFATTCNNMDFIIDSLKAAYISIYSNKKYLKELDENMKKHIKNNIYTDFDYEKSKLVIIELEKNHDGKKIKTIKIEYPEINKI